LNYRFKYVTLFLGTNPGKTREPKGGCPPHWRGYPSGRKKGGMLMYVTYTDLIQIGIFICALIGLCYTVFKGKK
jgi:hypothetical protein